MQVQGRPCQIVEINPLRILLSPRLHLRKNRRRNAPSLQRLNELTARLDGPVVQRSPSHQTVHLSQRRLHDRDVAVHSLQLCVTPGAGLLRRSVHAGHQLAQARHLGADLVGKPAVLLHDPRPVPCGQWCQRIETLDRSLKFLRQPCCLP